MRKVHACCWDREALCHLAPVISLPSRRDRVHNGITFNATEMNMQCGSNCMLCIGFHCTRLPHLYPLPNRKVVNKVEINADGKKTHVSNCRSESS